MTKRVTAIHHCHPHKLAILFQRRQIRNSLIMLSEKRKPVHTVFWIEGVEEGWCGAKIN